MTQWSKGVVTWSVDKTLYISVPFTWLVADADKIARGWKGKVLIGGTGLMKPTVCEGFEPIIFHNPLATFTSRGCPNSCSFCAVKLLEPEFYEIPKPRLAPIICDNNFTACSRKHQERVIDGLKIFPYSDFNQGLEARRFMPELADMLGRIKCKVRFAFDSWGNEAVVKDAIDLCRKRATSDIGVYCLIGFNDDPESAIARLELVRSWGIDPSPMRYQPLDAKIKNSYLHPNWTEKKMADVVRYYSRLQHLRFIAFDDYKKQPKEQLEMVEF
jgi:hypothetical protein